MLSRLFVESIVVEAFHEDLEGIFNLPMFTYSNNFCNVLVVL
jgi:hypothetical protein